VHRVHLCDRHTPESTVPPETAARPAPIPRARPRKTARATPACFESRRAQTGGAKNSVRTRTPSSRNNPKRCVLGFYFSNLVFKKVNCVIQFTTVRIVARRVRCPRLQAPSHNGSHCCPPGSLPTPASSVSQRFALLPAGFAAHACKLRLATVRIVARRVRCPRLQAPSRNCSHCCPPGSLPTPASSVSQLFALLPAGFAAHACKLRLATVRIVARQVRCPRLRQLREAAGAKPSGREAQRAAMMMMNVFYALSAPGGAASRRLTPRYLKPPAPRRRLRRPLLLHCLQARRCCIFALACSTPPPVHRLFCPSEGARRDSHHASAFTTGKAACLVVV
jgi:hypothetical protein